MKLLALFLLFVSVIWELGGTAAMAYMYPVIQEQFWYNVPMQSGLYDYCAGLVAGIAMVVILKRSEHHHASRHYVRW